MTLFRWPKSRSRRREDEVILRELEAMGYKRSNVSVGGGQKHGRMVALPFNLVLWIVWWPLVVEIVRMDFDQLLQRFGRTP